VRATERLPANRRITCVELEALFARGVDVDAARRALAEDVRQLLDERARRPTAAPLGSASRPISTAARVGVALWTATLVFITGVVLVEHLSR
jgi:hypothetical protein